MSPRRSRIRFNGELFTVQRYKPKVKNLVYALIASKQIKYGSKRSDIAYIGMTKRGVRRIFESAADKSHLILKRHGVKELSATFVTCKGRKGAKTWRKLERALIITFREKYGQIPLLNRHGEKYQWRKETEYFSKAALRSCFD